MLRHPGKRLPGSPLPPARGLGGAGKGGDEKGGGEKGRVTRVGAKRREMRRAGARLGSIAFASCDGGRRGEWQHGSATLIKQANE